MFLHLLLYLLIPMLLFRCCKKKEKVKDKTWIKKKIKFASCKEYMRNGERILKDCKRDCNQCTPYDKHEPSGNIIAHNPWTRGMHGKSSMSGIYAKSLPFGGEK